MLEGMTPPRSRAVYCKIDQLAQTMTDANREIFFEAIDNPTDWSANGLSTALRQRGVSVADTTIQRHRNKTCACYRG